MTVDTTGVRHAAWLHIAGFPASSLSTALAIGYAESGLNDKATHNNSNGTVDYGFMQVNSGHRDVITPSVLLNNSWSDPSVNSSFAFTVYQQAGNSFEPWSTFTGGTYQKYLPQAQQDVANLQANGPGYEQNLENHVGSEPAVTGIGAKGEPAFTPEQGNTNPLSGALSGLGSALAGTFTNAISNLVLVLVALVLLVLGVVILLHKDAGKAAGVAVKAALL